MFKISASLLVLLYASGRDSGCFNAARLQMPAVYSRAYILSLQENSKANMISSVVFAALIAATSISGVAIQTTAIAAAAGAASELFSLIDKKSKLDPLDESGHMPPLSDCKGNIEVSDLVFAYPSRPGASVLRNFKLSIPAGKTTALVGASGSGKSTIVGLLERWYVPSAGSIKLDGIDISEYNTQWLRSRVRLVQQA